ncbi:Gx transporter family protein [Bacillus sp. DNRA2]|uniref:Gx transporter family protein n=1 Tax=Bacillus sp. DNRA2 TaxID=2723053 RepID=UPI00145DEDA9|nr:Gx transporter family protein [Bacillus sp. DNRA2]NMD71546.1 Gx transporter family protein [Bacillus sp. DNRA2]
MNKNRKFAVIVILVTNAILISFLEAFIPIPVPVPGVKLGLGNIITMIGIAFLELKDVIFIVVVRCLVVAILTRGVTMLAFSLSGGILSALVMWFLYKKLNKYFSIKGISMAGAIVHSTAQIIVASIILGQTVVIFYLPILLISSVITGFITGKIGELAIFEVSQKDIFSEGKLTRKDAIGYGKRYNFDQSNY